MTVTVISAAVAFRSDSYDQTLSAGEGLRRPAMIRVVAQSNTRLSGGGDAQAGASPGPVVVRRDERSVSCGQGTFSEQQSDL